jgi:hypothetical protein
MLLLCIRGEQVDLSLKEVFYANIASGESQCDISLQRYCATVANAKALLPFGMMF